MGDSEDDFDFSSHGNRCAGQDNDGLDILSLL